MVVSYLEQFLIAPELWPFAYVLEELNGRISSTVGYGLYIPPCKNLHDGGGAIT